MYFRAYFFGTEARSLRSGWRVFFVAGRSKGKLTLLEPWTLRRYRIEGKLWDGLQKEPYIPGRTSLKEAWTQTKRTVSASVRRQMLAKENTKP